MSCDFGRRDESTEYNPGSLYHEYVMWPFLRTTNNLNLETETSHARYMRLHELLALFVGL